MSDMEHMSNTSFIVVCVIVWVCAFVSYRLDKRRNKR